MEDESGRFVVVYGPNNIGKSSQTGLVAIELIARGVEVLRVKYPIYDLEPTGPRINNELRGTERKLSDLELQELFAQNRRDYEPTLNQTLRSRTWVLGEDYKGTGIAWGVVHDIPLEKMERINAGLRVEDLAILLDGDRFKDGAESGHRHEASDEKWAKARRVHLELADRYGWPIVNANQEMEKVCSEIMAIIDDRFGLRVR